MRILKLMFEKNHLTLYENILKYALKNNYNILTLEEYYNNIQKYKNSKNILLRHDIDHDPNGALKMFEIEKNYGVKATYYFRWATAEERVIKTIKDAGFEVGLHYETISTYIKAKNLKHVKQSDIKICKELLEKEIERFELLFGKINSICSHGAKENREFKIVNTVLVDETMKEKFKIFEAYDLKKESDVYISDGDFTIKKWRYDVNPIDEIDKGSKIIYFLSHPLHWNTNLTKRLCYKLYRKEYDQYNI